MYRPQILTPDSSASIEMSDWAEPGEPGEVDFSLNKRWNASEDAIVDALASHFIGASAEYYERYKCHPPGSEAESIWEEYEYETAFDVGHYVRIKGQINSQWAEKDGMGTYWSKKAYRVVEIRMAHEPLKPSEDTAESGSDEIEAYNDEDEEYTGEDEEYTDEDEECTGKDEEYQGEGEVYTSSQAGEYAARCGGDGDGDTNRTRGLMRDTQKPLTAEMKAELETRVWYYRLDMFTDNTEHPLTEAM